MDMAAVPFVLCVLNILVVYERFVGRRGFGPPEQPQKKGPEPAGVRAIEMMAPFGDMPDLTEAICTCL
eukprot:16450058-Heterocapsa_arctica.AAC.1